MRKILRNIGLLWEAAPKLTIGAVFKTPFEADLKHERAFIIKSSGSRTETDTETTDENLDMPMSYGIGAAWRFSDNLTVSFDIYRTQWDDFILTDSRGNEVSPVTGKSENLSDIEPTHQIRMGGEYLYIPKKAGAKHVIPFRWGLFYDPAPALESPDDYFGFTLGTGIAISPVVFDIACQFRFGNDVAGSLMDETYLFSQDLQEHTFYASMIYHF